MTASHYHLINICVCLIGFATLYTIWSKIQRRESPEDFGYQYLAIAVLTWALSSSSSLVISFLGYEETSFALGISVVFSTFNNALFLFALQYFDFAPPILRGNQNRWIQVIIGSSLFVVFSTWTLVASSPSLVFIPDLLFSGITSVLVGYTFINSFIARKLKPMAVVTFVVVAIAITTLGLFVYQNMYLQTTAEIQEPALFKTLLLTTHLCFMLVFLASFVAWYMERKLIPGINEMKVQFNKIKSNRLVIKVSVDKHFERKEIVFSPASYIYFLLFAVSKLYRDSGLTPKELPHQGVIVSRIEKRIQKKNGRYQNASNPIANAALGKWPFFFEKGPKGFELTLLASSILIHPRLIHEQLELLQTDKLKKFEREIKLIKAIYTEWNSKKEKEVEVIDA